MEEGQKVVLWFSKGAYNLDHTLMDIWKRVGCMQMKIVWNSTWNLKTVKVQDGEGARITNIL